MNHLYKESQGRQAPVMDLKLIKIILHLQVSLQCIVISIHARFTMKHGRDKIIPKFLMEIRTFPPAAEADFFLIR